MQTLGLGASRPARSVVAAALLGVSLFGLSPAAAETLQGALAKAYQTNPTLNAARAIGDDTLQKNAGQRPMPHTFTHGSSAQRAQWFNTGLRGGKIGECLKLTDQVL